MVLILCQGLHFSDIQAQVARKRLFRTKIHHYQRFIKLLEIYHDLTKREVDKNHENIYNP